MTHEMLMSRPRTVDGRQLISLRERWRKTGVIRNNLYVSLFAVAIGRDGERREDEEMTFNPE